MQIERIRTLPLVDLALEALELPPFLCQPTPQDPTLRGVLAQAFVTAFFELARVFVVATLQLLA